MTAEEGICGTPGSESDAQSLRVFECRSGSLVVADPLLRLIDRSDQIFAARPGTWVCEAVMPHGSRVARLTARHSCAEVLLPWRWESDMSVTLGFDQVGVFDFADYGVNTADAGACVALRDAELWRWCSMCRGIANSRGAGVIAGGVVAGTSCARRSYLCYTQRAEDGECVGVKIVFWRDERCR